MGRLFFQLLRNNFRFGRMWVREKWASLSLCFAIDIANFQGYNVKC
jgi:hypothetical protein